MSRLGAAVIGLGVGEQHARTFAADPRTRLSWLCDRDAERATRLAEALSTPTSGAGASGEAGPRTSTQFEEVLGDPDTQIVSIATFDDQHADQVQAALAAGKHVFCEKPLCRTLDEARSIRAALARSPGAQLGVNLVLRGAPLYGWLRQAVRDGYFGKVYAFDGDYLYGRLAKITEGWRGGIDEYSVFEGGGVHLVDLMMWVLGERPATVTAVGNHIATEGSAFRYDDFVAATFQFPSGLIGRVTANFGCVHRHQHVVRLFGTERTFLYDDAGARVYSARDPGGPAEPIAHAPLPAGKGVLIPAFISDVVERRPSATNLDHELAVVSACYATDVARATNLSKRIEYV